MNNFTIIKTTLLTIVAFSFLSANAEDEHHEHHAAHIHGEWTLFSALDGKKLTINVKGPLFDVLGYERQPKTEEELKALKALKEQALSPDNFIRLQKKPQCTFSKLKEIKLPKENTHQNHTDHTDHTDHNTHDEVKDFEVEYSYFCKSPSQLSNIEVTALKNFSGIQVVNAVFVSENGQKSARLTLKKNLLDLR